MELPFTVNGIKAYYADTEAFTLRNVPEGQAYILDADGWNLYIRNHVSESLNNVRVEAGMPRLKTICNLRAEKIPYSLIRKVGRFFTEIHKKYQSEAVGYLYYAPSKGWVFWPPEQTATTAHCKYGEPAALEGYRVAGTIHSHGAMSAFHSGTDEKDEANFDGVHITIGKVDEARHDLALSVVCAGVRYKCTEDQLISGLGDTEVPTEWIDSVKQPTAAPTAMDGYTQGSYAHGQPQAAAFTKVTDSRASANPTTQASAVIQHSYTDAEWATLSKSEKKRIKKEQKALEGGGMLSFFESRRFGRGW